MKSNQNKSQSGADLFTRKIICIPAYLFPPRQVLFKKAKIIPGVSIVQFNGKLRNHIQTTNKTLPLKPTFYPTHIFRIDTDLYFSNLKDRAKIDGNTIPDGTSLDVLAVLKQSILSLILSGPITFKYAGSHNFEYSRIGNKFTYTPKSWSNIVETEMSGVIESALLYGKGDVPTLNIRKASIVAHKLDRYFRSGVWWVDKLAMAFGYTWESLCSHSAQQAFIGLTCSLEALLSTQTNEITHILAERVAVLTENKYERRLDVYRKIKDLYKIRSKLVHGNSSPKKGDMTTESLYVTAKGSMVPQSALRDLLYINLSVLSAVLSNKEFLGIIQPKRKEGKANTEIDDYFGKLLFS